VNVVGDPRSRSGPRYAGVDVGAYRKGFHVAVIEPGRLLHCTNEHKVHQVVALLAEWRPAWVAVDSPRAWAPEPERSRPGERELREKVGCGIRYTPSEGLARGNPYYDWICHGLELYAALKEKRLRPIECFPTASWTRWDGRRGRRSRAAWSKKMLANFGLGGVPATTNQDERDAIAAALTALEHERGNTDEYRPIVVPKPHDAGGRNRRA
jgi:predicted nuclease with RNAse H fold